jgi:hypothetical protein
MSYTVGHTERTMPEGRIVVLEPEEDEPEPPVCKGCARPKHLCVCE